MAVEERGRGYRVSKPFPHGELSGVQFITSVHQMVAEPVSRVIIRDPAASAEDFVDLAARLGLHGTDYVVGWTAWLDLAPMGVSKASGLAHVVERLDVAQADVLAIGDGRNDIEMLEWAGRGVAMGQAVQEVTTRLTPAPGPCTRTAPPSRSTAAFGDGSTPAALRSGRAAAGAGGAVSAG